MSRLAGYRGVFLNVFDVRILISLMLIACISTGCTSKIQTTALAPARAHEAAKLRHLAVMTFSGQGGALLSHDIEAELVNIHVKGQPYFTVVEREALEKTLLKEIGRGMTGIIDEATAVRVGKLVGAEGMILGAVQASTVQDSHYTQDRSRCIDNKCKRTQQYTVNCTQRDAHFTFTPKIINVETGRIAASENMSGTYTQKKCQDDGSSLENNISMLEKAKRAALQNFRTLVAPHDVTMALQLLTKDNTEFSADVKEKVKNGVKWAKEGRVDRACEQWEAAYDLHPNGYAIPYNLGVCAELTGRLTEAARFYEQADTLTNAPVKEINDALVRIRNRQAAHENLKHQMVPDGTQNNQVVPSYQPVNKGTQSAPPNLYQRLQEILSR